jgi:hypothetical protein
VLAEGRLEVREIIRELVVVSVEAQAVVEVPFQRGGSSVHRGEFLVVKPKHHLYRSGII